MRKQLSKKEIKDLNEKIKSQFNIDEFFGKKDDAVEETNEFTVIKKENKPVFVILNDELIPTLKLLLEKQILPTVTVDMGAIKFVTSGADVMRPGIKSLEVFEKNKIVCIVEETHKKPLAVGRALFSSEEMTKQQTGKAIKNLHYVGDKIWQLT